MDHLEVIKLSRKLDRNGSIMLSMRYTPLLDEYLSDCKSDDETEGSAEAYSFNGWDTSIQKWVSFGTLSITKKQNCYHLIVGFFGHASLIERFLATVFECYFTSNKSTWISLSFNMNSSSNSLQTWTPEFFLGDELHTRLLHAARSIVDLFVQNKKYSVMVFNASPSEKRELPYCIQSVLAYYKRAGHIWKNIDLSRGNFNLTDEVLSEVSMKLPSIATYTNVLVSYKDALNHGQSPARRGFQRYSENKQTLTGAFDKMGDTEGTISIVFCDCENSQALDALAKIYNTNHVEIQSFYRKGRIDGELSFVRNPRQIVLYDKITETYFPACCDRNHW